MSRASIAALETASRRVAAVLHNARPWASTSEGCLFHELDAASSLFFPGDRVALIGNNQDWIRELSKIVLLESALGKKGNIFLLHQHKLNLSEILKEVKDPTAGSVKGFQTDFSGTPEIDEISKLLNHEPVDVLVLSLHGLFEDNECELSVMNATKIADTVLKPGGSVLIEVLNNDSIDLWDEYFADTFSSGKGWRRSSNIEEFSYYQRAKYQGIDTSINTEILQ